MRKLRDLTIGWINADIREVVETGLLSQFSSVLLTSIDSTTDLPNGIGKRVAELDPGCAFLGKGVIVPGQALERAAAALNLFNGFDELWCFERAPSAPVLNDLSLVAPFNIENDLVPSRLISWMAETDCKLGLGDGIGLNYATRVDALVTTLERLVD
jgi:hypothetical protein